MTDILKALSVDVHCDQCGDFDIGADVIAADFVGPAHARSMGRTTAATFRTNPGARSLIANIEDES